ncbi:hypothetical protein CRE_19601 [Caenorhabditis remanei]|uniref:F-box domain-containing protein n=1 Tax=Caenorhabditis remanei TaxID=31234 RepID=E3NSK9_CAERE|nr:hypothetical protein CRE_19601 [Caenorhabditis remanei]
MVPPKLFPIHRLPFLAIEETFKAMDPIEIINFSVISKRTRTVAKLMNFYSKYSIHLSVKNSTLKVGLYRTNEMVSCIYGITSNEKKIGKIKEKEKDGCIERKVYNYSKNPLEEWKQLCKHVLDIFKKQTIDDLSMQMDALVDQNVSLIDFLKANVKSVDECCLYQLDKKNNVDENFAYLLDNLKINKELCSHLHVKNDNFDKKIPKSLRELRIYNSHWIGYEKLMEFVLQEMDRNGKSFEFKYLELDRRELDRFRELVLYDIPHEVVDGGVERNLKIFQNINIEISGGIDIRRIDGKTATFFLKYSVFMMSVH